MTLSTLLLSYHLKWLLSIKVCIWLDMSWSISVNNISYVSKFISTRFKEILSRTLMQEPLVWHVQLSLIHPITLLQKSNKVSKFHIENIFFTWKPDLNYILRKGMKFENFKINCSATSSPAPLHFGKPHFWKFRKRPPLPPPSLTFSRQNFQVT